MDWLWKRRQLLASALRCLLPLALLAVSGCSMIKLSYDHLGTLVQWKLDDYVEFNDAQQQQFDAAFDRLWVWHRHTQLPVYATTLRQIATAAAGPLTSMQIDLWITQAEQFGIIIAQRAEAPTVSLLRSLSDAQVRDLLIQLDQDNRRRADKVASRSAEQQRARVERKMRDTLEDWIGDLSSAQQMRLHAWALQRQPTAALKLRVYRVWRERLVSVLKSRQQAGFDQRFSALFTADVDADQQHLDSLNRSNRNLWVSLLSDLSGSLSPRQRRYLQHRLRSTADDLQQLANGG